MLLLLTRGFLSISCCGFKWFIVFSDFSHFLLGLRACFPPCGGHSFGVAVVSGRRKGRSISGSNACDGDRRMKRIPRVSVSRFFCGNLVSSAEKKEYERNTFTCLYLLNITNGLENHSVQPAEGPAEAKISPVDQKTPFAKATEEFQVDDNQIISEGKQHC